MHRGLGNPHREYLEWIEGFDLAIPPASQQAEWNLRDNLARVDEAEAAQRAGQTNHGWGGLRLAILEGQTPDQARARIIANYQEEWGNPCRIS